MPGQALERLGQEALEADIDLLLEEFNRDGRDTLIVPCEYLEIVIAKN